MTTVKYWTRISLINTLKTLHQQFQCRLLNFVLVAQTGKTQNFWYGQLRLLQLKQSKTPQCGIVSSYIDNAQESGSHKHMRWPGDFNFGWSVGWKKGIPEMGAVFAHNWTRTQSCLNFEGLFGVVQPPSGKMFALFHILRVKMFPGLGAEEGQGGSVNWQEYPILLTINSINQSIVNFRSALWNYSMTIWRKHDHTRPWKLYSFWTMQRYISE